LDQYHFDQNILELYLFLDHWNHQLTYLNNLNNSPQEICDIPCNLETEGKSVVLPKLLEHVRVSTRAYPNNLNNSPQEICLDQSLYFQLIPWFQIIDYRDSCLLVQEVQHERSIKGSSQKGENIRKSLQFSPGDLFGSILIYSLVSDN
jgi:hypothetical protein